MPRFEEDTDAFKLSRNSDPHTSFEAGKAILKDKTLIQRRVMEEFGKAHPYGLTDYELEERCGSHNSTFRTRRSELVEAGLLMDSGQRRVLKHVGNKSRIVWTIKPRKPEQLPLL